MLKLFKSIFQFSRKAKRTVDPQIMQRLQARVVKNSQDKRFTFPDLFTHQDIYYQEILYGNKCNISGITENNLKSAEFTQEVLNSTRPKLVILGGLNDTEAMLNIGEQIGRFTNIQNLASSKLYCKSTFLPLIQKKIEEDPFYFEDHKKRIIWRTDKHNRCFRMCDYINATYNSLIMDYKIIYGKPSSIFIFEDLMLTLELPELKEILNNTLYKVEEVHGKTCDHTMSIVMQQVKMHSMMNEPRLYSKEVTYTTALLNRLTKIESKNLLLINTCFVKKIAENVHNTDFEPESVYRKWMEDPQSENYEKFSRIMGKKKSVAVNELMQKFAILSILKGFHLECILRQGRNIFKNSIFSQLLGKQSAEEILDLYEVAKYKYMKKIFEIQRQRIRVFFLILCLQNRLEYNPPQTTKMYLSDQFEALEKRQEMFLYEFEARNYVTEMENGEKLLKLEKKIEEILENECDEYEKNLIEQYKKGQKTKEGIILYSKLIGRANVELRQKVKLPYYHFNAFRGFYKEYYRDHLLFDKDMKQKRLDTKKMKKIEERFERIGKEIRDPELARKYLTGQMGFPVKEVGMYENEDGEVDFDGEMEDIEKIVKELGNEDMIKEMEEYKKANPNQKFDEFDDGKPYDADQHDSKDDD